jgi:hypothetical protein
MVGYREKVGALPSAFSALVQYANNAAALKLLPWLLLVYRSLAKYCTTWSKLGENLVGDLPENREAILGASPTNDSIEWFNS